MESLERRPVRTAPPGGVRWRTFLDPEAQVPKSADTAEVWGVSAVSPRPNAPPVMISLSLFCRDGIPHRTQDPFLLRGKSFQFRRQNIFYRSQGMSHRRPRFAFHHIRQLLNLRLVNLFTTSDHQPVQLTRLCVVQSRLGWRMRAEISDPKKTKEVTPKKAHTHPNTVSNPIKELVRYLMLLAACWVHLPRTY